MTEANPIEGEKEITFKDKVWRFVFDWQALVAFEKATQLSFAEFMGRQQLAAMGGPAVMVHHLGEFMRCGLLRHHPEVTAEFGAEMAFDEMAKSGAFEAAGLAMPDADAEEGTAKEAGEE